MCLEGAVEVATPPARAKLGQQGRPPHPQGRSKRRTRKRRRGEDGSSAKLLNTDTYTNHKRKRDHQRDDRRTIPQYFVERYIATNASNVINRYHNNIIDTSFHFVSHYMRFGRHTTICFFAGGKGTGQAEEHTRGVGRELKAL